MERTGRRLNVHLITWCLVVGPRLAGAEVIHLKDGRRIEAKVTKRTEASVTVDWFGVPLTYWLDEVERIEESAQPIATPRILPAPGPAAPRGPAARLSAEQQALLERVLERSGLKAQLEALGQEALEQFDEGPQGDAGWIAFLEANRDELRQMSVEAYDPKALLGAMTDAFAARFDEEKLRQLDTWLASPLAQRMTAVELAAQQASPEAMQAFFTQAEQDPPAPRRVALIERLMETTDTTDSMIAALTAVVGGLARAFAGLCPLQVGDVEMEIRKLRELYFAQHREKFHEAALEMGLFTYQEVSDEELAQYVEFYESELGQWFNRLAVEGLTQGMGRASNHLAGRMVPLLRAAKHEAAQPAVASP
jgi:hypothetical protein